MKKVVVDPSVAIKWFVPEIHSETATHLLELRSHSALLTERAALRYSGRTPAKLKAIGRRLIGLR
jgi:predicted nucleic acid-binding protein